MNMTITVFKKGTIGLPVVMERAYWYSIYIYIYIYIYCI